MNTESKNILLRSRIISASIVTTGGFIIRQALRLAGNLILTRLLLPEYFGIMGIVTIFLVGVAMFSDLGVRQSIIQSENGKNKKFLDTAWTIQCIKGMILSIIILIISIIIKYFQTSGYLSSTTVYGDPLLPSVLVVMSISPFISGTESTYIHLANRKLEQIKLVQLEIIAQLIGLVVLILGAWFSRSIWALVIGGLSGVVSRSIMSHLLFGKNNFSFKLDREYTKEIINYGKWILLASISGFLLAQGDRLILGGLISSKTLGIYSIAFFLANAVQLALRNVIQNVFFPVLSNVVRNRKDEIGQYYYKIRSKTDAITMFVSGLLFVIGSTIVSVLYDERYWSAGWMLEILSFSILSIASFVSDQLFLALGKPKWMSFASSVQTIFMYISIPLAFNVGGILLSVYAIGLAFVPKYIVSLMFLSRLKILSVYKEIRFIPLYALGAIIGSILKYLFENF